MGPVSASLIAASAGLVIFTRNSRDRTVTALSWYVALDLLASLLAHGMLKGASRSTPMMLADAIGLYIMGLAAVCRFDRPLWLYGLCLATGGECASHFAYVAGWIGGDAHTLSLNLLFAAQVACLAAGRRSAPEDDLHARLPDEFGLVAQSA